MNIVEFTADSPGIRLDKFLAERIPDLSRSQLRKLLDQGAVTVNGKITRPSHRLSPSDTIRATIPPPHPTIPSPESIPLDIVCEDPDILVLDKHAGMTVHPGPGNQEHTLVNAILAHCSSLLESDPSDRPGIVHRLDKDTSGLMVVAKTTAAREALMRQFKSRSVTKGYTVLVKGHVTPEIGSIEAPIGRDPVQRKRMAVVDKGKEARTAYRVLKYPGDYTLLEVIPKTGRTHQIRVHLSAIGHAVAGDSLYGGRSLHLPRQFLHASRLGFHHPTTRKYLEFTSSLPVDLKQALADISRTR